MSPAAWANCRCAACRSSIATIVNRDKELIGILSLRDVATLHGGGTAGGALGDISQPGGQHTQV